MTKTAKQIQAELQEYLNSKTEKQLKKTDNQLLAVEQIRQSNIKTKKANPPTRAQREHLSKMLKGVPFEERVGLENVESQKKSRSRKLKGVARPRNVVNKIVQTKKETGAYASATHGMNNKTHKDSSKSAMSIKAKLRQELKAKLGLGRNDKVPKELLEKEYKKYNL